MIGNRVQVRLCAPDETAYGELRKQSGEGVWVYHSTGMAAHDTLKFYPMHRVVEIMDRGPVYR